MALQVTLDGGFARARFEAIINNRPELLENPWG